MPFKEDRFEFAKRHGNNSVKVEGGWLFPDGAMVRPSPLSIRGDEVDRFDPPTDPLELLNNIKIYNDIKLQRAETDFHNLKSRLLEYPGNVSVSVHNLWEWDEVEFGPAPPDADGKTWLGRLRSIVMERREKVKSIDAQIGKLPNAVARQEQATEVAEIERQRREKLIAYQTEIVGIEII